MSRNLIYLLVIVLLIGVWSTLSLAKIAPDGWTSYSMNDEALTCGNYSKHEWEVKLEGEQIKVRPVIRKDNDPSLPFEIIASKDEEGLIGDRHVEKVTDGWLVGFDAGEWGGALWWFSEDGKNRKKLIAENVVGLQKMSDSLFAIVGLAHMGMDYGKVFRVKHGQVGWEVEPLGDLDAVPRTFTKESPESVLIVTTKSLSRVKTSGTIEKLLQTKYQFLYPNPNSMALSNDGIIHVGMRHFITRLTPAENSYKEVWFVPTNCQKFELQKYDCVCHK